MEPAVVRWARAARLVWSKAIGGVAIALLLSGCGGGGGSSSGGPATYSLGGTITGLAASGLVLGDGNDAVSPTSGATSFTFPSALASGSNYAVTIKTQPMKEVCRVTNGSGRVGSAAVTSVMVTCTRDWIWLSGSSTVGAMGVYGTLGTAAASNVPGARNGSSSWTDSAGELWLFGGSGFDSTGTQALLNDLWRYTPGTGQWTWVSGSNTAGAKGAYGILGMGAADNEPGARSGSVSWTDSAGNLWLFGGYGLDSTGTQGDLNDLWRYSPGSGQWTWVSGSDADNAEGEYGTLSMAAPGNVPGARIGSVSWTDSAGDLWLFGGVGIDSAGTQGDLNDLWRYDARAGQWTWVSGSSTVNSKGVYGAKGTSAAGNVPGAREGCVSWTDSAGDLWVFGGVGYASVGEGYLNDLWQYSPGTGQWTWISGSNTANAKAVYGTLGTAAAGNVPGGRVNSVSWIDSAGDLWVFGGFRFGRWFNELWRYTAGTGEWTWVSGSNTAAYPMGVYGTLGMAAPGNVPGARFTSVSWIDSAGGVWLFGGVGTDSAGTQGDLNDLWAY